MSGENNEDVCPICLGSAEGGVVTPCCLQKFCSDQCLESWIGQSGCCPLCRQSLLNVSQLYVNVSKINSPSPPGGDKSLVKTHSLISEETPILSHQIAPKVFSPALNRCIMIFGILFLIFALFTLILTIVWKTTLKSPWDGMSNVMLLITVSFFVVGLATIIFVKCFPPGNELACQHCCAQLIITAAAVFFSLAIVGAAMNGYQVKYTGAVLQLYFDEYVDKFSIDTDERIAQLEHRRPVMTALFIVLIPSLSLLWLAIMIGISCAEDRVRIYHDLHTHFQLDFCTLNMGLLFSILSATSGLWLCASWAAIVSRAPSPYAVVFLKMIPFSLASSLVVSVFLLVCLVLVCTTALRHTNIHSVSFIPYRLGALFNVLCLGVGVFQLCLSVSKVSYHPYVGACEDWSVLNNTCGTDTDSFAVADDCEKVGRSLWHYRFVRDGHQLQKDIPEHAFLLSNDSSSSQQDDALTEMVELGKEKRENGRETRVGRKDDERSIADLHVRKKQNKYQQNEVGEDLPCYDLTAMAADMHRQAKENAENLRTAVPWINLSFVAVVFFSLSFLVPFFFGLH